MENECVLRLDHLVFDEVTFRREGFKTSDELKFEFGFNFESDNDGNFIAHIRVIGKKQNEYTFIVRASGYFYIGTDVIERDAIIHQNAVAIIFPYVRSQISMLTAQPEVDPVVVPPLNIAQIVENAMKQKADSSIPTES